MEGAAEEVWGRVLSYLPAAAPDGSSHTFISSRGGSWTLSSTKVHIFQPREDISRCLYLPAAAPDGSGHTP